MTCLRNLAVSVAGMAQLLVVHMLDGVKGRDSGVLILRDGRFLGGGPYFWSTGSYTVAAGTWKGDCAPTSTRRFPTRSFAHYSEARKSPAGFPGRLPMTKPRCSAPRWSAAAA